MKFNSVLIRIPPSGGRREAPRVRRAIAGPVLAGLALVAASLGSSPARAADPIRVNIDGPSFVGIDYPGTWQADPGLGGACGPLAFSNPAPVNGTNDDLLFQGEVYGNPVQCAVGGGTLPPGLYQVNLYFTENFFGPGCPGGGTGQGARVFDIYLEGSRVLANFDIFREGGCASSTTDPTGHPVIKSFTVAIADGTLDLSLPASVDNGKISAIEILPLGGAGALAAQPSSFDFGPVAIGSAAAHPVTLTNLGSTGDPAITVTAVLATGAFGASFAEPITLSPGDSTTFDATFTSAAAGPASGSLQVVHDGANAPLYIPLQGTGFNPTAPPISFSKSLLSGADLASPTSLQFGPDGRLYVAQVDGTIKALTIGRSAPGVYAVTAAETITLIRSIPNHDDDGTLNPGVTTRQVTGLLVKGTAVSPVIYVTSSDPRSGGGGTGIDTGLDTNSGIVSRLTRTGGEWTRLDLVRGLPRSEERHSTNGLQLDEAANVLYVAQGGNTNQGAPSNNFALLPEYALSGAILSIDLNAIGETTYDLPTLDDPSPDRDTGVPGVDLDDPFGGNNGANQARIVPGGPVQVYSPGWRNPYDIVLTASGRLYAIDNGPNAGWGDVPVGEGTPACTNAVHEPGVTYGDQLQFIPGPGFYAGHPNPTRANLANTWNGQSPVPAANPIECNYLVPGAEDGALAIWDASTDGLTEYTATNFGGAMAGDLLAGSFNNTVERVKLNAAGTGADRVETLFSNVGGLPLDVTAQGDAGPFPGTIWVADYVAGTVIVFEPIDFTSCSGANDPTLDEDGDGYSNADEISNGTNPCSAADVPPDFDHDFISDKNDPDDDNDGIPDTSDPFAVDPANGATTSLPVFFSWSGTDHSPGGLLGLGFTGLMTNGHTDYLTLFDPAKMTAGGAAGVMTIDQVPEGDATGAVNTQQYAFQFGVNVGAATSPFTAHTRVLAPFAGLVPQDFQSMGLFVGTGDQDNYAKVVLLANGGAGGVQFVEEVGGTVAAAPPFDLALPGPEGVDLYLTIDPAAATVQPAYSAVYAGVQGPIVLLGAPAPFPAAWLGGSHVLAVGVIATSAGPAPPFAATWDFIEARAGAPGECSLNSQCDDGNPCTDDVCNGGFCAHFDNTAPCNDGAACTTGDVCSGGVCKGSDLCPAWAACSAASGLCAARPVDFDNDGLVGAADPCPADPLNRCFGPAAVDGATGNTIRLHAGASLPQCAEALTDCDGAVWLPEFGDNLEPSAAECNLPDGCPIAGLTSLFGCASAATQQIFQCEHWDLPDDPELAYTFTVPNGRYLVNLLFANTYTGTENPGQRTFDLLVQGQVAYGAFDQVAAAGGSGKAVVRSAIAVVTDGTLRISFGHVVENPAIKGIEVLREVPVDADGDGVPRGLDCDDTDPTVYPGAPELCDGKDNDCNGIKDDGLAPVTCGVGACRRTVSACVLGAAPACVPGAPSPETCNGVDDDCDGTVDDVPPPAGSPRLAVDAGTLSWSGPPGATLYDVVRGDLGTLHRGHGVTPDAVLACLADQIPATVLPDAALPDPGNGFWFVVRGGNCGGRGSYDDGDAAQVGRADPAIAISPSACP